MSQTLITTAYILMHNGAKLTTEALEDVTIGLKEKAMRLYRFQSLSILENIRLIIQEGSMRSKNIGI